MFPHDPKKEKRYAGANTRVFIPVAHVAMLPFSTTRANPKDVWRVTTMEGLFDEAVQFNVDIGKWNVGKTEEMNFMFFNAGMFNQVGPFFAYQRMRAACSTLAATGKTLACAKTKL